MLLNVISIVVSLAALGIAGTTLWLTHFRRGSILLSQPTIFYFGWDVVDRVIPKIFFRSAIFCTSKRGIIIENLYLKVRNRSGEFTFSFWGYDDGKGMVRGSGVYVSDTGFVANHHFNPSADSEEFDFDIGEYSIEVWAKTFGFKSPLLLGSYEFNIDDDERAMALSRGGGGVMWDWLPGDEKYLAIVRPKKSNARFSMEAFQ